MLSMLSSVPAAELPQNFPISHESVDYIIKAGVEEPLLWLVYGGGCKTAPRVCTGQVASRGQYFGQ